MTPDEIIVDDGAFTLGGITFQNAGGAVFGSIAMQYALQVSSDVFYYTLGDRMYPGLDLQRWARRLGIGEETGIDLPLDSRGLLPTPRWRNELFAEGLTDRRWSAGDNVNLAVGQGDLQASPLQMAVAYAAIANGGEVRPSPPRPADRGRRRPGGAGDRASAGAQARHRTRAPPGRSSTASTTPPRRPAAPRTTSSGASRSRWRARPARPSARPTRTSPGTW